VAPAARKWGNEEVSFRLEPCFGIAWPHGAGASALSWARLGSEMVAARLGNGGALANSKGDFGIGHAVARKSGTHQLRTYRPTIM
jgi:hypothetical protein